MARERWMLLPCMHFAAAPEIPSRLKMTCSEVMVQVPVLVLKLYCAVSFIIMFALCIAAKLGRPPEAEAAIAFTSWFRRRLQHVIICGRLPQRFVGHVS